MFKRVWVLYITVLYAKVINTSKCKEYMIIISEDLLCPPIRLIDIDWQMFSCPYNSTDVLTYEEFYSNKECVIEMTCNNNINQYNTKLPECKKNTYITTDAATTSTEKGDHLSYYKVKGDTINQNNEINLIFDNNIRNNSGYNEFNKYKDTEIVMSCDYTENICTNGNYNDSNDYFTINIKTIVVSLVKEYIDSSLEHTRLNKNITAFNCTSTDININNLNKQYMAITYEIMRKFHCQNNTDNSQYNKLSFEVNRKVNIYNKLDIISDDIMDSIKCTQNFRLLDRHTLSLVCETVKLPDITSYKKDTDIDITDSTNVLIRKCDYSNSNYGIMCDNVQSQKYKLIYFQNCTEDHNKINKEANIMNINFIINLNKTEVNIMTTGANKSISKFGPFCDNFKIQFVANKSNYIEFYKLFNITEGRIFNLWTNDEERAVRKYYNRSSLININLSNFIINSHLLYNLNNSNSTELKLDIILNKKNMTNPNIFINNYFNKADNIHTNRGIINCIYPDLNNTIVSKKSKLELNCEFEYIFPLFDIELNKSHEKKFKHLQDSNKWPVETSTNFSIKQISTLFTTTTSKSSDTGEKEIDKKVQNARNNNMLPTVTTTDLITNFTTLFMRTKPENNDLTVDKENIIDKIEPTAEFNIIYRHPKQLKTTTTGINVSKTIQTENISIETSHITTAKYTHNGLTVAETIIQNTNLPATLLTVAETSKNDTNSTTSAYKTETTSPNPIETTTLTFNKSDQLSYNWNITKVTDNTGTEEISPLIYVGAILATICILSILILSFIKFSKPSHNYSGISIRDNKPDTEETEL